MNKFIFIIFTFSSVFSFGNEALISSDFTNLFEDIHTVDSAELVFTDDLQGIDLYKVAFIFEILEDCSEGVFTGTLNSCGESAQLINECLYVFHDTHLNEFEVTEFSCDRDIEDVLPGELFDDL